MTYREYHVHINGLHVGRRILEVFAEAGLRDRPFIFAPDIGAFTPKVHFSAKTDSIERYREIVQRVGSAIKSDSEFIGYMEGEFVHRSEALIGSESQDWHDSGLRFLYSVSSKWRETELHVRCLRRSPLVPILSKMGLMQSLNRKEDADYVVSTVQGTICRIEEAFSILTAFIEAQPPCGEVVLKEERLLDYACSRDFNWLPFQLSHIAGVEQ